MFLITAALTGAVHLGSCVSSIEPEVTLNEDIRSDDAYFRSYSRETREAKVIGDFEHKFTLGATRLTPELLAAVGQRQKRLLGKEDPSFLGIKDEGAAGGHFLVSVYSPSDDVIDLADKRLWSVAWEGMAAKRIKRLNDKTLLKAFFGHVNGWGQDYIVSFEGGSSARDGTLRLSSVDGQVAFDFGAVQ